MKSAARPRHNPRTMEFTSAEAKAWLHELSIAFLVFFGWMIVLFPFIAVYGYFFRGGELYCIWNPWIDTVTTEKYSETAFDAVRPGMTPDEVLALLGDPFYKTDARSGGSDWRYTHDGKAQPRDYAWFGRIIKFEADAVASTEKRLFAD